MKKLTDEELDQISDLAVETAENYIFSRVSPKEILDMDINVEVGYEDGLDVDIQVELDVDQLSKADENEIVEEATDSALIEIDKLIEENFH